MKIQKSALRSQKSEIRVHPRPSAVGFLRASASPRAALEFANESMPELVLLANDGFQISADEMVIPFGEIALGYGTEKIKQRLNLANAQKIVDEFNSPLAKIKRLFRGKPVFIGHPDVKAFANQYTDKKSYAWIRSMEVRDGALVLKPEWSAPGRDLVENKHYVSFSPVWLANEGDYVIENGWKVYSPFGLKSVGLTNENNWPVLPLANEAEVSGQKSEVSQKSETNSQTEGNPNMNLLQKLLELLGLAPEQTETDVVASVETLLASSKDAAKKSADAPPPETVAKEKADAVAEIANCKSQIAALTTERDAAKTELANERTAKIELVLANEIGAGRITAAQKDEWAGKLAANFATASVELANVKPALKTKSALGADLAKRTGASVERSAQIIQLVNERMTAKGDTYEAAFLFIQKDAANAALFAKQ